MYVSTINLNIFAMFHTTCCLDIIHMYIYVTTSDNSFGWAACDIRYLCERKLKLKRVWIFVNNDMCY